MANQKGNQRNGNENIFQRKMSNRNIDWNIWLGSFIVTVKNGYNGIKNEKN